MSLTPPHYSFAWWCFAAAAFLLSIQIGLFLGDKYKKNRTLFMLWASIVACLVSFSWVYTTKWMAERELGYRVIVSPSKVTLSGNMSQKFTLTITNNQDFTIFNVNLGVCLNYRACSNESAVNIEPTNKEDLTGHNVKVSMCAVGLTNGCEGIVFNSIGPRAMKSFSVTIEGQKLKPNSQIAFEAYNWYLEPKFEFTTVPKKWTFEGLPQYIDTNKLFDKKSSEEKPGETGYMYRWLMKLPKNPFFPKDEGNQNDYWCTVATDS